MQQIRKITLPGIVPTIVILLIIRVGQIASLPLEQVLLMQNPLVMEVSEVFDTYAFTQGIMRGQVSIGVAVGLIKGLIGVVFIVSTNKLMKRLGYEGLY
jgi:putative aldouronate transport system permease protein